MGKDYTRVRPPTQEDEAQVERAMAKMREFRERWQATAQRPDGVIVCDAPQGVFASLTREVWAGQLEAAQVAGTYTANIGQPTSEAQSDDDGSCKGCGAGLIFTNFGRNATCGWCKREYRR